MLCDRCHARPAVVHITQIVNGHKIEHHYCSECAAKEHVLDNDSFLNNFDFSDGPFRSLFHRESLNDDFPDAGALRGSRKDIADQLECPKCNTNFDKVSESGNLGCPHCYDAFRDRLKQYFDRTQGAHKHIGKRPNTEKAKPENLKLLKLQNKLQECIQDEDYEQAAKIRDEIQKLKKDEKGGTQS